MIGGELKGLIVQASNLDGKWVFSVHRLDNGKEEVGQGNRV